MFDEEEGAFNIGSPLGKCPRCGGEYLDRRFREIALEEDPPTQENERGTVVTHKKKWGSKKKSKSENVISNAGIINLYNQSAKRISDYEYLLRLYKNGYAWYYPKSGDRLISLLMESLVPYIDILEEKLGPSNITFKLKNPEALFSQLTYDAKNPKAVETVVKDVLSHYGVDQAKYIIQVEYQEKELNKDGGTLGTFTKTTPFGGIIKVVLVPRYSEYDAVISVILHECAHALLSSRMISLPEKKDNERLTDVAAIYMGGANYIKRGYYMYKSFRIGYLLESESDLIIDEIERRRKQLYGNKEELIEQIEGKLKSLPELSECLHPNRVIREKTIVESSYSVIMQWEEQSKEIPGVIKKMKSESGTYGVDPKVNIRKLQQIHSLVNEYDMILREWRQAEEYQAGLTTARKEYIRGIMTMAEKGNVLAKIEMIKFWSECSGTSRDAAVYYNESKKKYDDPDAFYIVGICCMQGLVTKKDEDEGKAMLCQAAALGSQDAVLALGTMKRE